MQIILLEKIDGLGSIGDIAIVRNGFARNYLLPYGKALPNNAANRAFFEVQRAEIEAKNASEREQAEQKKQDLDGVILTLIRQSGDTGRLYGSVSGRDIAAAAIEAGHQIDRRNISLDHPIKSIGVSKVNIRLHPEVLAEVRVNVARSADEAERQAAGENVFEKPRDAEPEQDEAPEYGYQPPDEAAATPESEQGETPDEAAATPEPEQDETANDDGDK